MFGGIQILYNYRINNSAIAIRLALPVLFWSKNKLSRLRKRISTLTGKSWHIKEPEVETIKMIENKSSCNVNTLCFLEGSLEHYYDLQTR